MIPALTLTLATAGAILAHALHRRRVRKALRVDRSAWRAQLARGLEEAARDRASASHAAAAALHLVAQAIQGTGELGFLESSVLAERVREGARLDAKAILEPSLQRTAQSLTQVATARELARLMEPTQPRDASLRQDVIRHLDHATQALLDTPTKP